MTVLASFNPQYGSGVTVAPTTVSASSAVGKGSKSLCLTNLGLVTCYVRVGVSGVAATTADYPVPSGAQVIITKFEDDTHVAYVTSVGTGSLHIMSGEGF